MKTVCIMVHDDGTVMVGEAPAPSEQDMRAYQTTGSVDEALERARAILTDEETTVERQAESDMDAGYNRVRNVEGY